MRPNWLTRLTEYVRKVRRWRCHAIILSDQMGVTITRSYEDGSVDKEEMKWRDVNWAVAHKKDCYTVDQIRIEFLIDEDGKSGVLVTESMEGWEALIDALPTYLPGTLSKADWWDAVVKPAFATNWTILYTRSN
jgi:hypothetical protein